MYRLNGYFHLFILEEMQGNIFSICIVHPLVNQWEGRIAIGLQASDCECEVLSWRIWQIFSSHFILKDLNVCLIRIFSQEINIFSEHLDLNFMKRPSEYTRCVLNKQWAALSLFSKFLMPPAQHTDPLVLPVT